MAAIDWQVLQEIIQHGYERIVPLGTDPETRVRVRHQAEAIAVWINVDGEGELPSSVPSAIQVTHRVESGKQWLVVQTDRKPLYREFCHLINAIVARVSLAERSPEECVKSVIDEWRQLLSFQEASHEFEIGLWGELWFLEQLVASDPGHIDTWFGPEKESHDFRLPLYDVEVKTTSRVDRVHQIHGLQQLSPSIGRELYLLSIQIVRIPSTERGRSVRSLISGIRQLLQESSSANIARFDQLLDSVWPPRATVSEQAYSLRNQPILCHVNGVFPRLLHTDLAKLLSSDALARLQEINYAIDITGLGLPWEGIEQVNTESFDE